MTGSDAELGKPSGSDERHGKVTYVSLYGLERARELAVESHRDAVTALEAAHGGDGLAASDRRLHLHPDVLSPMQESHLLTL